ncbi:MAG: hypothetical protein M3Z23_02035, partial [Acidobacteriota bacterium]|nr:hypothetical protein [Acidobacteriota bacterium]
MTRALASLLLISSVVLCQQPQNPSPMVEHAREHPRLTKQTPSGRRVKLELGTLFLPQKIRLKSHSAHVSLLVFFHGGEWLPEVAAASQKNLAVVTVQGSAGSGSYAKLFADSLRFSRLIAEAGSAAGVTFDRIELGGWSAGCGGIRQILQYSASYQRVSRVLCIDGIHTGYPSGKPGPAESRIDPENLQIYVSFARDAIAKKKRL